MIIRECLKSLLSYSEVSLNRYIEDRKVAWKDNQYFYNIPFCKRINKLEFSFTKVNHPNVFVYKRPLEKFPFHYFIILRNSINQS